MDGSGETAGRAVAAALLATAIAVPVLPLALAVTGFSELAMMQKLLHSRAAYTHDLNESERTVGAWLVAIVTGFCGAGFAGYWANHLVRGGRRRVFVPAALAMLAALLALVWRLAHLRPSRAHFLDAPLLALAWAAAAVAYVIVTTPSIGGPPRLGGGGHLSSAPRSGDTLNKLRP